MAQQRRDEQFQNISRTDDRQNESDIHKNDGLFGNTTSTEPVAAYPVTEQAYVTTATGNVPGVGGTATTTRYEYTAVYGTTAAPGFDGANAGGGQWGQEANTGVGGGGDNNLNKGRDQK
ncbi:hypothetical protein TSUD_138070 [Trifolium subterraneum]|uniref:Uncharacterized protein n=1 Tax=Trifolium subterraneum TaxID=3900 RepID=A0A2Z6P4N2_TRISU|nr:hypothetical protein TSUD_138070 [Trifolium subterraneum]